VRSERSGSKRWGAIFALLFVGLLLGGVFGGWIGSIVGAHQSDVAEAAGECYLEGCAFMVVGFALYGLLLGAILGAILGGLVGVRLSRKPTPPSTSGRLQA
jgi:ABC-type nitrate/sulfonate/bicarbonate transport system permease component